MPSRTMNSQEWNPSPTSIQTREPHPREPRDEYMRLSKTSLTEQRLSKTSLAEHRALRPMPLNLSSKTSTSPPIPRAPPPSRKESSSFECPRDPEIVDLEPITTWPRRDTLKGQCTGPVHSPSIVSQQSGRQSEMSLGILDYYMRDPSPTILHPALPSTPKSDPSIDRFDFGVPPTPTPLPARSVLHSNTRAGAERKQLPPLPPSQDSNPNKAYTLFPAIRHVTPSPRYASTPTLDSIAITPSNQESPPHPDPAYRPRKESISSSARSRTDSIASSSFRRDRRGKLIPLRILSGDSLASSSRTVSTSTTLILNSSPDPPSRWSDETITSPSAVPTSGHRTSFGSLLHHHHNETQYPDCFFEDDNEDAPLRRKFAWKRSIGSSSLESGKLKGRFDEEGSVGRRFMRWMLCGCGGR